MQTFEIKVNGYSTLCHVEAMSIIGAIRTAMKGLNVTLDDILEVKKIFRNLKDIEFKQK